jgi:hypothetical protein
VQRYDTVFDVARRFGLPWESFCAFNAHIADCRCLYCHYLLPLYYHSTTTLLIEFGFTYLLYLQRAAHAEYDAQGAGAGERRVGGAESSHGPRYGGVARGGGGAESTIEAPH